MSPAKSATDIPCLPQPQTIWSQRVWPRSDIIVQGEGLVLDTSHNKSTARASSTISANGRLGGSTANQMRSYLQAKVGALMMKPENSRKLAPDNPEEGSERKSEKRKGKGEGWVWDADPGNAYLNSFLDKADTELYQSCREHLDAINQCTQLQQAINDEMRTQAELDQMIYESMKAKRERLEKQTGISSCSTDQAWVKSAFTDLRKCVTDQAHAHHVYSQTLINQSTAIQQSLDSHKDLMERTKQTQPTLEAPSSDDRKGTGVSSMSFVQATCVFESVRKPRLKLISELDYLSTQMKSIDDQLRDVDSVLANLKESEDADHVQWRFQIKLEEARTKHDFLSTRRPQLERELKAAGTELKTFHLRHRDKMVEVANVFRQHRTRCDSTLRKSFSLLRAASRGDPEVLKTLDAHKESWLSPVPASTTTRVGTVTAAAAAATVAASGAGSLRTPAHPNSSLLKRRSSEDKNLLKARKVCFGGTHYSDSGDGPERRSAASEHHGLNNHSSAEEGGSSDNSESKYEDASPVQPKGKAGREKQTEDDIISPHLTAVKENETWRTLASSTSRQSPTKLPRESQNDSRTNELPVPGFPRTIIPSKHKFEAASSDAATRETRGQGESNKHGSDSRRRRKDCTATDTNNSVFCKDSEENSFSLRDKSDSRCSRDYTTSAQPEQVDGRRRSPVRSMSRECTVDTNDQISSQPQSAGEHARRRTPHATIVLSTDSQYKRSPSKEHPGNPTTLLCDSSASTTKNWTHQKAALEISSYWSDSEASSPEKGPKLLAVDKKDETMGASTRKLSASHKAVREDETSAEQAASKSSFLTNDPLSSGPGHPVARTGDVSVSCDTGRRRVAFSDIDTTSQRSEGNRRRAGEASNVGYDRGILKKPTDSNMPGKTVIMKEDKIITSRLRHDHRRQTSASESGSHATGSDLPSQPQQTRDKHRSETDATHSVAKDSPHAIKRLNQTAGAFIPEITESSSSESSSSPEKVQQPSETMRQFTLEDNKIKHMMLEQKRMAEEEDKINRLISKYANNRRGLSLLSKNFNNCETTVSLEKLSDGDAAAAMGRDALETGKEDRLEFDEETKHDADIYRIETASLGAVPRQVKVCAVRPISSDPSDCGQVKASADAPCQTDPSDVPDARPKPQLDREAVARLRRFEVTAGQFVVVAGEPEGCTSDSIQSRERTAGDTDEARQTHEPCLWSVQRYSDSQRNVNNNLSFTLTDATLNCQTNTPECFRVSFKTTQASGEENLCFRDVPSEENSNCSSDSSFKPVALRCCDSRERGSDVQHDLEEASKSVTSKQEFRHLNGAGQQCACQSCNDCRSTAGSSSKSQAVSGNENEGASTPWLNETGYESYSPEEKRSLPDPGLLRLDAEDRRCVKVSKREIDKRPLKSCLKRSILSQGISAGLKESSNSESGADSVANTNLPAPSRSEEIQTPLPFPVSGEPASFDGREERWVSPGASPNTVRRASCRRSKQSQKRVQFRETVHYSNTREHSINEVQFYCGLTSNPSHLDSEASGTLDVNNNAATSLKDIHGWFDCRKQPRWSCSRGFEKRSETPMLPTQVKLCLTFQEFCDNSQPCICALITRHGKKLKVLKMCLHSHHSKFCIYEMMQMLSARGFILVYT